MMTDCGCIPQALKANQDSRSPVSMHGICNANTECFYSHTICSVHELVDVRNNSSTELWNALFDTAVKVEATRQRVSSEYENLSMKRRKEKRLKYPLIYEWWQFLNLVNNLLQNMFVKLFFQAFIWLKTKFYIYLLPFCLDCLFRFTSSSYNSRPWTCWSNDDKHAEWNHT